ncbi:MAG TPA: hypothetical protein VIM32_00505 [Desulfosporosinus sp.]
MTKRTRRTFIHVTAFVVVMLVFQVLFFRGSVRTLTQNDITKQHDLATLANSYKLFQFTIDDYTVNLKVPESTEVHVSPDQGENMRFSLYFLNRQLAFRGYVQVWKVKDLTRFLSDSKALSPFDFKSYSMSKVQENNYQGFKTEWTADLGQNLISGKEYWLTLNSEEVARISFFTDTGEFPGALKPMTQQIINSLMVNKINR